MIPTNINKWIQAGKIPQRMLLSGSENVVEIALEIASELQNTSIEKIRKGIHSDTQFFQDNGKSFKIDWSDTAKKDNQSVHENVRGMITWCNQKPVEGKYRIVILENLERLSRDAPHACLKLIEEPPKNVVFLFTTQNHHHERLLDTIISRLTLIRLPRDYQDFEIMDEVQSFLGSKNLIQKFKKIEELDKSSKDNKDKKINRTVFYDFLDELILHARFFPKYHKHLEILSDSYCAIGQNLNPKFSLERLAIKITKK